MISRPGSLISLELWRVDSSEVRLGVKSAQSEGEPHLVGSYQEKSYWGGIRINQSKKVSGKILVGWGAGGMVGIRQSISEEGVKIDTTKTKGRNWR